MSKPYAKPAVAQMHQFLTQAQSLIVHFSGCPPGSGKPRKLRFPDDLRNVVAGAAMGGISCSLVKPGDTFHGEICHSLGTVGVIVGPTKSESLVAVDARDAGSYEDSNGARHACEQDITADDLVASLRDRKTRYNEWVVRDYVVLGLFLAEPLAVWGAADVDIPPDAAHFFTGASTLGPVSIEAAEVLAHFPDCDVYTFQGNDIVNVRTGNSVAHEHLYPAIAA